MPKASMPTSQRIVQVCLFLVAAICELLISFIIALAHSASQRDALGLATAA